MQGLAKSIIVLAALILAGGAGYILREALPLRDVEREKLAARIRDLEGENERLQLEARKLREAQEKAARKQVEQAVDEPKEPAAPSEEAVKPEVAEGPGIGSPPAYQLASAGEADAIFRQAIERGDVNALIQLGSALLTLGEPGFDKLIELFGQLDKAARDDKAVKFWLNPEMAAGRFFRAAADRHEEVLRMLLYLNSRDPATLPGELGRLRKNLVSSEVGSMILGFSGSEAPELQNGFLEIFRQDLEGDLNGNPRAAKSAIYGLAQLPSEQATDVLLELLPRASDNLLAEVIAALGFQGNRRSLPVLQALRNQVQDTRTVQAIDAAIKVLE
jgi:HEAT repeat protein